MTQILICCGVGGTGKTTLAAALGVGHAYAGQRAVVLTIDPARRLADALNLATLGNEPQKVELEAAPGSLYAMMLDRKGTWDDLIRHFSKTPEAAKRLLENRYYRAVSTRLTGSHEYMAIEKLYELVQSERWDIVIVDTPPTQHVVDFFDAPQRIDRILDRTVLQVLSSPRNRILGAATRRGLGLLYRLAGEKVMRDIEEFFSLLGDLSTGFRSRSREVGVLLQSDQTQYFLVTDANAPQRNDLLGFLDTLKQRNHRFSGFLVNRFVEEFLTPSDIPDTLPGLDSKEWGPWREFLTVLAQRTRERATLQQKTVNALSAASPGTPIWLIPYSVQLLDGARGLQALSQHLPPHATPQNAGAR